MIYISRPMLSVLLLLVPTLSFAAENICFGSTNIFNLYNELQCEPQFTKEDPCPKTYNCSKFQQRDHGKCFHGGNEYDIGAKVEDNECMTKCRCMEGEEFGQLNNISSVIECETMKCPQESSGTKLFYQNPDQCCPLKQAPKKIKEKEVLCMYGNATYTEGEKFTTDDCMSCVCQANWRGRPEKPFCSPVNCNLLLHSGDKINQGCAPIYDEAKPCCPISWRCPDRSDVLLLVYIQWHQIDDPKCRFGRFGLYRTQKINSSDPNEWCRCETPPMITCTTRLDTSL